MAFNFNIVFVLFLHIIYFEYLYIIIFIICVLSCRCHSVALWSFCLQNKFLVCANIPGNKADSDSETTIKPRTK